MPYLILSRQMLDKEEGRMQRNNVKGNGMPGCTKCMGRGVYLIETDEHDFTKVVNCSCVVIKDILLNLERGWKGLTTAKKIKTSSLKDYTSQNLRILTDLPTFRAHLRSIAIRMGPKWFFRVEADRDLVIARLASVKASGREILDTEVATSTIKYMTLEDLVDPPELLILILGVKSSRNSETPDILLDSLQSREFLGKPTWVIEQSHAPLRMGHLCYSAQIDQYLSTWEKVNLSGMDSKTITPTQKYIQQKEPANYSTNPVENTDFFFGKKKDKRWKK